MNELKPEDVMRALELHADCETDNCFECPYEKYLSKADGNCVHHLSMDALALLREKDADIDVYKVRVQAKNHRIEELTQSNAELTQTNAEKDAEIERLKHQISIYHKMIDICESKYEMLDFLTKKARSEAITEFAERLEQCTECMGECTVDNPLAETYSVVREEYIDQIAEKLKGEIDEN